MRTAFIKTLTEMAARDPRVMLVVGDLGFGVVVDFAKRFPNQFLNAGVAEQNMTGIAAGLAMSGRIVFTYSIANFPTLRCIEQIRNDVCYHHANVTVVAVGGGLAYGSLGMTHHATEDIAILRSLPRMTVLAPGDPTETEKAVQWLAQGVGPSYLRLGRAGEASVHSRDFTWTPGKAVVLREGKDITLIAAGDMLGTAVKAAAQLAERGYQATVLSMHTIKPLDTEVVVQAAKNTPVIVTLEEHGIIGGLGSAVAETLCEADLSGIRFQRIALPSEFCTIVGDQDYLRRCFGLDVDSVVMKLLALLRSD
jgi:transketolase